MAANGLASTGSITMAGEAPSASSVLAVNVCTTSFVIQCVSGRARESVLTYAPQACGSAGQAAWFSSCPREEGTRAVSDFPTLALSRSGGTGISQPSQRRAPRVVKPHRVKRGFAIKHTVCARQCKFTVSRGR